METLLTNRRVIRAAPDRQLAKKTLVVATFSLLRAVCTEASADCRDEVAGRSRAGS